MTLLANRLAYLCTIERNANSGSPDPWGNPVAPDWEPILIDQPCVLWTTAGREVVSDTTTVVVVEDMRLLLPAATDVTAADRVVSVTYRGGMVQDGPLGIRAVLVHRDHIELVLVEVA